MIIFHFPALKINDRHEDVPALPPHIFPHGNQNLAQLRHGEHSYLFPT
jgi:hypothetical protein